MPLTLTQLRHTLDDMDAPELRALITELYQASSDNKRLLTAKLAGDNSELLNKLESELLKAFGPTRGFPSLKLAPTRKALRDYLKVANPREALDAELRYVEAGTLCTNTYGDIDEPFYDSLVSVWQAAMKRAATFEFEDIPCKRLERLVENAQDIGWGFTDGINETYDEFEGKVAEQEQ